MKLHLSLSESVTFPFPAVLVVHFPLLAGQGGAVGVEVVKMIPETLAVPELTQVIFTSSGWLQRPKNKECSLALEGNDSNEHSLLWILRTIVDRMETSEIRNLGGALMLLVQYLKFINHP